MPFPTNITINASSSTSTLWLVAACTAAAATATAMALGYHPSSGGAHQRGRSGNTRKIPSALLKSPYSEQLKLAVKLALQAGDNMVGYCDAKGTEEEANYDLGISTKTAEEDFCTQIDIQNEKLVMDGIKQMYPNHFIIGEETTGTGDIPSLDENNPTWIIDPIDGTTNFASGIGLTCVSIGYCDNECRRNPELPVMGVIYAPVTNELYLAIRGYGAYRNGIRIVNNNKEKDNNKSASTTTTTTTTKSLSKAIVCCEFGYPRDEVSIRKMTNAVENILKNGCRAIRQLGSGCLDLCYVATGRLDVVYAGVANEGWKPWDYAAGYVIVTESGCVMESIDQSKDQEYFDLYSKSIICATNQELLEDCRKVITS